MQIRLQLSKNGCRAKPRDYYNQVATKLITSRPVAPHDVDPLLIQKFVPNIKFLDVKQIQHWHTSILSGVDVDVVMISVEGKHY